MSVGERLKKVLEQNNWSIKEFADRADMPYRSAQSYLSGQSAPGAEVLHKLSARLCIDLNWLVTGEGPMFRSIDRSSSSAKTVSMEDLPVEGIHAWLDEFWRDATPKERAWLEIQMERSFPEYAEWLKKNGPQRKSGTA